MRVLELFAGAGGATTGLMEAGLDVVRCIEHDPHAHATALAAGHPSILGDVRDPSLDVDAEVVWASFPCQAWSVAGKRLGASDERNGWPWTFDTVQRVAPAWFVGENVVGLTLHSKRAHGATKRAAGGRPPTDPGDCPGCYFERVILRDLRGRFVEVSWRILDAADYGVPQRRRRVIIVAGPQRFEWSRPTHFGPEVPPLLRGGRRPWVTMGEALGIRVVGGGTTPRAAGRRDQRTMRDLTDEPSTTISMSHTGNALPFEVVGETDWLDRPSPTVTTTEVKGTRGLAMFRKTASGIVRGSAPDRASDALWLATGIRRVSVQQAATLQSFPPDYPWRGTQQSIYRQIGNAVPPTLAEAVGRALLAP